jgi:catalase
VLFDAVALLLAEDMKHPAARDFAADAFRHCKIIAFTPAARTLMNRSGAEEDEGTIALDGKEAADAFLAACRKLRFWPREQRLLG